MKESQESELVEKLRRHTRDLVSGIGNLLFVKEVLITDELEAIIQDDKKSNNVYEWLRNNQNIVSFIPHESFFDFLVAGYLTYTAYGEIPPIMVKKKHLDRIYGPILRFLAKEYIVVDNDGSTVSNINVVLKKSEKELDEGNSILLFPEGTRHHGNDYAAAITDSDQSSKLKIFPWFIGASDKNNVPVVPVCLARTGFRYRLIIGAPINYRNTYQGKLKRKERKHLAQQFLIDTVSLRYS